MFSDTLALLRGHGIQQRPSTSMPGKHLNSSPKESVDVNPVSNFIETRSRSKLINSSVRDRRFSSESLENVSPRKAVRERWEVKKKSVSFSDTNDILSTQLDEPIIDCEPEWDCFVDAVSEPSNLDDTRFWSTRTLWSAMAPTGEDHIDLINRHKRNLDITQDTFEDDLDIEDEIPRLPPDMLKEKYELAKKCRNGIRDSLYFLRDEDRSYYDTVQEQKESLKKKLVELIKKMEKRLIEQYNNNTSQPAHTGDNNTTSIDPDMLSFKQTKVRNQQFPLGEKLKELKESISEIKLREISTDHEFYETEEEFNILKERANLKISDAEKLIDDAVLTKLNKEASELTEGVFDLKQTVDECAAYITHIKSDFGLLGGGKNNEKAFLNIKIPTFSAKKNSDDYLTFKKKFKEYVSIVKLSRHNQLALLKNECLTENNLRMSVARFESMDEVFKFLDEKYGNPEGILYARRDQILALGQMPRDDRTKTGVSAKQREWVTEVDGRLREMQELAKFHKLETKLYHNCAIIPAIESLLPFSYTKAYQKMLMKERNYSDGDVQYLVMMKYLTELNETLTFQMHHESANVMHLKAMYASVANKNSGGINVVSGASDDIDEDEECSENSSNRTSGRKKKKASATVQSNDFFKKKPAAEVCPLGCGDRHTHIFYCREFQKLNHCKKRFEICGKNFICMRCLSLDSKVDFKDREHWWENHDSKCVTDFACVADNCAKRRKSSQVHMLLCGLHYKTNKDREKDFIESLDQAKIPTDGFFTIFHSSYVNENHYAVEKIADGDLPDPNNPAIYMIHNITVKKKQLLCFYDSGAISACISSKAYNVLNPINVREGPTAVSVAGGQVVTVPGGDEKVKLNLEKGGQATMIALKLACVTTSFPVWEISRAWDDVVNYSKQIKFKDELPTSPARMGGQPVDILVGIKYRMLYPTELFTLPCGLGVYRAKLKCSNGHQAVLGGPHAQWRHVADSCSTLSPTTFFTMETRAFCSQERVLRHVISMKTESKADLVDDEDDVFDGEDPEDDHECFPVCGKESCVLTNLTGGNAAKSVRKDLMDFEDCQKTGSEVDYRCMRCRICNDCKKGDDLEKISLQEEREQFMIEAGVELDVERKKLITSLPFIKDPVTNLNPNKHVAIKVLESQRKLCSKNPEMAADLTKAHEKLRSNGFVCKVSELPEEQRKLIYESPGAVHYIPWRSVYKADSLSTPVRLVFDASSRTPGGESLNGVLGVGRNTLADLYQLLLRFRSKEDALCCDIATAYNMVELKPEFYKYQLYLWQEEMNPNSPVEEMVIKTLIYGVGPAGNITIAGFNKLADHVEENDPQHADGAEALRKSAYMDDVACATDKEGGAEKLAADIEATLAHGSMSVKAFTFSQKPPPEKVSADGETVGLLGYRWYSATDQLALANKNVYLDKAKRGKHAEPLVDNVEQNLLAKFTRRTLTRIVAAIFDPLGLVTPVTAGMKLDLHEVVRLGLDWDDPVPNQYLPAWVENVEKIRQVREIRFQRAIVPEKAADPIPEIIVSCDASEKIAICTVHAAFKLKEGGKSVQLLTAKSKLVTDVTVPRAELKAVRMGASLAFIVGLNIPSERLICVTDSAIVLYWLNQDQRPLQTGVRNAVIEVRRLTNIENWYHIESELNIADHGTRKEKVNVNEIGLKSIWQKGPAWMQEDFSKMPLKTFEQVKLTDQEKSKADLEVKKSEIKIVEANMPDKSFETKVAERYKVSNYLPDPARMSWFKLLRCRAAISRFVKNLKRRKEIRAKKVSVNAKAVFFSEEEIKKAEEYFFIKATVEVKTFNDEKKYKHCSREEGGVLNHTGRIVDGHVVEDVDGIFSDLEPLTFSTPLIDRFSPLAYCIMSFAHQEEAQHRNGAATLLASRYYAHILHGKSLADFIVENCPTCIKRKSKLLEAEMGKLHSNRLTIAPPFYYCQVDIFGPYSAICEHNHRSTVKVWGLAIKCTSTLSLSVHALQKYNADAFLTAFMRFAEKRGYPKKIYIDSGSQLVKGCKEAQLEILDLVGRIQTRFEVGIDFETCAVAAHNANGQVERAIKEIKRLFDQTYSGLKLDLLNYETAFSYISNLLNNMPICIGTGSNDNNNIDLITPSRLLYGRNNRRAPAGRLTVDRPSRLLQQIEKVRSAWWEVWRTEVIGEFIPGNGKWAKTGRQPEIGDTVVFIKDGGDIGVGETVWSLGLIDKLIEPGKDEIFRDVVIKYKNPTQSVYKRTTRSVRKIAILFGENELTVYQRLKSAKELSQT